MEMVRRAKGLPVTVNVLRMLLCLTAEAGAIRVPAPPPAPPEE
jgi:hypothetical protein